MPKYKVSASWYVDAKDKPEAIALAAKTIGEQVEYVSAKKVESGILKEVTSQIFGTGK